MICHTTLIVEKFAFCDMVNFFVNLKKGDCSDVGDEIIELNVVFQMK